MVKQPDRSTQPEVMLRVEKLEISRRLSQLAKKLAASGLRLTDGSGTIKAMAFIGGGRIGAAGLVGTITGGA